MPRHKSQIHLSWFYTVILPALGQGLQKSIHLNIKPLLPLIKPTVCLCNASERIHICSGKKITKSHLEEYILNHNSYNLFLIMELCLQLFCAALSILLTQFYFWRFLKLYLYLYNNLSDHLAFLEYKLDFCNIHETLHLH